MDMLKQYPIIQDLLQSLRDFELELSFYESDLNLNL